MNKKPANAPAHKQYQLPPQEFDAYNKNLPVQEALGSKRTKQRLESADLRSTNWVPGVSGWRLTPTGIEIGSPNFTIPVQASASITLAYVAGTLTATTIGATGSFTTDDWTVTVVNGLITAIVTRHSLSASTSPSKSPSLSPSLSPSKSPSVSPSVSPS